MLISLNYANKLIKKVPQSWRSANKAQNLPGTHMNIYQSKNLAVITISRFTIEGIQPATGL